MTEAWKTRIAIGVGLAVLIVPTVTILGMSDAEFRARCKAQCPAPELTYRVRTTGPGTAMGGLEYPATCHCIRPDQRSIWEQLRDLIW